MAISMQEVEGGIEEYLEGEINPELKRALGLHIVDKEPGGKGNVEKTRSLGAMVGAVNSEINRCEPAMKVDRLALEAGKSVVVIGPNGSGKTTIFDALMEIRNADFETKGGAGGMVYGKSEHSRDKLRIARLNQEEILGQIGDMKARDVLDQSAKYFKKQLPINWEDVDLFEQNTANEEAHRRIEELISKVAGLFNMEEFLDRNVSQLSGGERTKVVLLTVLASEPDVLLLDEPTNHLDMVSIAKLTALFNVYKKSGTSIASISHVDWFLRGAGNDGVIEAAADEKGREVRQSTTTYEKYLKDRSRKNFQIITGDIDWRKKKWTHGETVISAPEWLTVPDSPLQKVKFPSVQAGEVVFLSGENGTGKTKLMEALVAGRGKDLQSFDKLKGVNFAYMPQFWPEDVASGTLEDFFGWVKESVDPHSIIQPGRFSQEARDLNFGGNKKFEASWLKRKLNTFSGGEQRLLWFLAVSSVENVDVLVLDEPTNHMDRQLQARITKAMQNFPGALVISTHDVDLMKALSLDVGKKVGSTVKPRNLVLTKQKGLTSIAEVKESPYAYAEKVREEASRKARNFKL